MFKKVLCLATLILILGLVSNASANMLQNGSFETGDTSWWPSSRSGAIGYYTDGTDWNNPPEATCDGGSHWGTMGGGASGVYWGWAYQEVAYTGSVVLDGCIKGGLAGGGTFAVYLVDGPYSSTEDGSPLKTTSIIDKAEIPLVGGMSWTAVNLSGNASSGTVTVVWGLTSVPGNGQPWGSQTIHGDAFNLVPEPATIALLGLGGLALLRKRR